MINFKLIKVLAALILSSILLTGCWYPENFEAVINIKATGEYDATYKGHIVASDDEASEPIGTGSSNPMMGSTFGSTTKLLEAKKKDSQRVYVSTRSRGDISTEAFKFPNNGDSVFFSIRVLDNGNILAKGTLEKFHEKFEAVSEKTGGTYSLNGTLKISVDGFVVAHNADIVSEDGSYHWGFKGNDHSKEPYLIIGCVKRGGLFCPGSDASVSGLEVN